MRMDVFSWVGVGMAVAWLALCIATATIPFGVTLLVVAVSFALWPVQLAYHWRRDD